MKMIKKILFFLSLFLLYIIFKEFLILYHYARSFHPVLGYGVLIVITFGLGYFIILPLFKIISMPARLRPARNPDKVDRLIQTRMKYFLRNSYLNKTYFDFDSVREDKHGYTNVINHLKPEMKRIRKNYVTKVFYSTAIAQNGFLDAVLIISSSVHMIKEYFLLYHGRVSNRDLWKIARMVYWSMIIGGSEGIEYAVDEIISRLFGESIKGITFSSRILGSVADGLVNAALLTRIALITENYCTKLYIKSNREIYPNYRTIVSLTQIITGDLLERISREVKKLTRDKSRQLVAMAVNPVKYVIEKAFKRENGTLDDEEFKNEFSSHPFSRLSLRLGRIFRKS